MSWFSGGENATLTEIEKREQAREKYRREALYRPQEVQMIALNHVERDAAREVYQVMEACLRGEYQRRTGTDELLPGLNSAHVVDEIINAINLSRAKQAAENLVCLREDRTSNYLA
jgi:hypothetical protein